MGRQNVNCPSLNTKWRLQYQIGLHLLELWAIRAPQETVAISIACFPQTDRKSLLLKKKKTAIQIIVHGEFKLMPIESSNLCNSVVGTGRYSADYQKGSINTNTATENLIFNGVLPDRCALAMVSQSLWEKLTNGNKHQIPALT